jgi:ATP-binding cassette, subfamily B (MDR/TAP), member 1
VLSEDIGHLNGMTTEHLAILIEASLTLLIGMIFAMSFTWKMGLITLVMSPFVSMGGIMMSRLQYKVRPDKDASDKTGVEDPYKKSNALLSDIIMNYRTVIGFGSKNVEYLLEKFDALLDAPNMHGIKNAHISGFYFGYSQCIRFIFVGIIFYISAEILYRYDEDQEQVYIGVYTLFVSALGSGISLSSAPSVGKAKAAASTIFAIIDEPSQIDTRSEKGEKLIKRGEIQFKSTEFKYPSRNQQVLNGMNLLIPATKKIALVGHSGCGKSTMANLLLRLYDVTGGSLLIDGIDIKDYNVRELRKQIGIVMQEPLLFNTTIKENILYGNDQADDAKVRQVAQMANALQFIESNIEDLEKEDV